MTMIRLLSGLVCTTLYPVLNLTLHPAGTTTKFNRFGELLVINQLVKPLISQASYLTILSLSRLVGVFWVVIRTVSIGNTERGMEKRGYWLWFTVDTSPSQYPHVSNKIIFRLILTASKVTLFV